MSITAERVRQEAASLSAEERAELAHYLLCSLDDDLPFESEKSLEEKLARRSAEIRAGTAIGIPADEVIAELRAKYL